MAWCHQATSYYLSQCWPRSMLLYGITRPQWVWYNERINLTILSLCWTHARMLYGWAQDCSNSIANALESLQSCTDPLIPALLIEHLDCLVQESSNSIAITLELLQFYTNPSLSTSTDHSVCICLQTCCPCWVPCRVLARAPCPRRSWVACWNRVSRLPIGSWWHGTPSPFWLLASRSWWVMVAMEIRGVFH